MLQKATKSDVRFAHTDTTYHVGLSYQQQHGASSPGSLAKIAAQGLLCDNGLLVDVILQFEAAYLDLQRRCADQVNELRLRCDAVVRAKDMELIRERNKYEPKAMAAAGLSVVDDASASVLNRERGPHPEPIGTTRAADSGSSTDRKKRKGLRNQMNIAIDMCGGQVHSPRSPYAL